MGRKVNPISFRLGGIRDWDSRWYADRNYTTQLHEDLRLRRLIKDRLRNAGVSRVIIARSGEDLTVNVNTAKPGVVIGKAGATVDALRNELEKTMGRRINLNVVEIRAPDLDAHLLAENIAEQITRRISYRRAQKQGVQRAMRAGARGVRIRVSGLVAGPSSMSRSWTEMEGRVPLQTLRSDIDYGQVHVHTPGGRIGVKVYIYRGDPMGSGGLDIRPTPPPQPEPRRRDGGDRGRGRGPGGGPRGQGGGPRGPGGGPGGGQGRGPGGPGGGQGRGAGGGAPRGRG